MPKVVTVRMPDDLLLKLEGKKTSEVIIEALREHFNPPTERKRGAMMEEGLSEAPVPLVDPGVRYRKPAHAMDCKCWICAPPKG